MKLFVLLICLAGLAPAGCNVAQFASMIQLKTGKNALSYNGYGCYCGLGGTKQPLDATDRCCHTHDCCYSKLKSASSQCHPILVTYKYSVKGGQIICGSGNLCQRRACECDKAAAECFKRNLGTYNKKYMNYLNLWCKGSRPPC